MGPMISVSGATSCSELHSVAPALFSAFGPKRFSANQIIYFTVPCKHEFILQRHITPVPTDPLYVADAKRAALCTAVLCSFKRVRIPSDEVENNVCSGCVVATLSADLHPAFFFCIELPFLSRRFFQSKDTFCGLPSTFFLYSL